MKTLLLIVVMVFAVTGCEKSKPDVAKDDIVASAEMTDLDFNCVMNGLGIGQCSFTNTTDVEESVCGEVELIAAPIYPGTGELRTTSSSMFCSGPVGKQDTVKKEFQIIGVQDFCKGADSWSDVCSFDFTAKGATRYIDRYRVSYKDEQEEKIRSWEAMLARHKADHPGCAAYVEAAYKRGRECGIAGYVEEAADEMLNLCKQYFDPGDECVSNLAGMDCDMFDIQNIDEGEESYMSASAKLCRKH